MYTCACLGSARPRRSPHTFLSLAKQHPQTTTWQAAARVGRQGWHLLRPELIVVGPGIPPQARPVHLSAEHLHAGRQARKLRGLVRQEGDGAPRVAAPQHGHKTEVGPGELVHVMPLRCPGSSCQRLASACHGEWQGLRSTQKKHTQYGEAHRQPHRSPRWLPWRSHCARCRLASAVPALLQRAQPARGGAHSSTLKQHSKRTNI